MPYRIDFVHGRGHEMILDKEGGISRGDLDELEINMLRSQRIPCLLPVEWMEMDGHVTFRYALNGKKMLLHRLQQEPLTMEQYYGLLLRVVSALLECRDYMLRPEGCLLGDTFLFVGDNLEDLSFVYVPLKRRKGENDPGDDLLALLARWAAYVDVVNGEGLRSLLHPFNSNRWPLAELRRVLLELLGKQQTAKVASAAIDDDRPPGHTPAPYHQGAADAWGRVQEVPPAQRQPEFDAEDRSVPRSVEHSIALAEEDFAESNQWFVSRRWVVGSAFMLGAACIWRFTYLGQPSSQTMLISTGLTLLLIVGAVLLWRKGAELLIAPSVNTEREAMEWAGSFELQSGPLLAKHRWQKQSGNRESEDIQDRGGVTTNSMGNYSLPPQAQEAMERERAVRDQVHVTAQAEPTTILCPLEADRSIGGAEKAVLKRSWNGKESEIPILEGVFQLGRVNPGNGYEEKAEGVSRLHLEIAKEQGCYVAKDLGSRNGSLLNGTMMIPYKSYPLAAGDMIQLAGSNGPSYQFKMSRLEMDVAAI